MKRRSARQSSERLRGTRVGPAAAQRADHIISIGSIGSAEGASCRLSSAVTQDTSPRTMRSVCFCLLLLLLPWCVQAQRRSPGGFGGDALAVDVLSRSGALDSLLRSERQAAAAAVVAARRRRARAPRPASQVPKRAQQGSRFALSLDVPTSILSVLIDLAKNQDLRSKAAANAELMARIGKRK